MIKLKPSSKNDGKNLKISRKGNGYHRSQKRNLKLTSRVGQRKSWHHVWEFLEKNFKQNSSIFKRNSKL